MDFSVDDLLPICNKCEGSGNMENPAVNRNQGGYGQHVVWASPVPCDACNGKGVILTKAGEALLEFFRRARSKQLLS
jgi:DnaJ-class molecular chaperone